MLKREKHTGHTEEPFWAQCMEELLDQSDFSRLGKVLFYTLNYFARLKE